MNGKLSVTEIIDHLLHRKKKNIYIRSKDRMEVVREGGGVINRRERDGPGQGSVPQPLPNQGILKNLIRFVLHLRKYICSRITSFLNVCLACVGQSVLGLPSF